MVEAILLDVGGTLWPNRWPFNDGDAEERVERLLAVARAKDAAAAQRLVDALDAIPPPPEGGRQDADGMVRSVVEQLGLTSVFPNPALVRRAVCLPALHHLEPLPGADALLDGILARSAPAVLVSNTLFRDGAQYLADFADFGLGGSLAGAVTSVDVGYRKPHQAMFLAALSLVGAWAERCVMLGDSERADIAPAKRLGMKTIRVAIEEPLPAASDADLVTDSLTEAGHALARL